MKHKIFAAIPLLFLIHSIAAAAAPEAGAKEKTPGRVEKILDITDDLYRTSSSHGTVSMKIVTEHWTREMEMEIWTRGEDMTLIRILSPKKEKGTATLRNGTDIWNYLPKVNRVIKLPSSMMSDSWMGSHFTNNDLVKESRMAEDYNCGLEFEGARGEKEIIQVNCIPGENAAVA